MSLLDRVRECNLCDLSAFVPFRIGTAQAGWVHRDFSAHLTDFAPDLTVSETEVRLSDRLDEFDRRTAAMADVINVLARRQLITGWRDERVGVVAEEGAAPLLTIERAAGVRFGIRTFGVQLLGYVKTDTDIKLWVAERSAEKSVGPGQQDVLVGGGMPYGTGIWQNAVREAWEEAGIPPELVMRARPTGAVRFLYQSDIGLDFGTDYQFDLELPADFHPRNMDGEVAGFRLIPAADVMAEISDSPYFYDANLAFIAFFLRHGLVSASDPDFEILTHGLRGRL